MMSKKGIISFETLMMGIIRMVEYIIAFFILYAIVSMFIITKVDTSRTEGQVYTNRIIYAASYQDPETGRLYPGVIDSEKMTNEVLAKKIKSSSKAAVSISFTNKQAIYNERYFNYLQPLAESKIPGKSATLSKQHYRFILHEKTEKAEAFDFAAVTVK